MSLDVDLMVVQPVSVYQNNITHNLGKMASEVKLSNGKTLYDVLWRPDEHGFVYARDISDLLQEGYDILKSDKPRYKVFNPENGWGSYTGLCYFVDDYKKACLENPDAKLRVSR
jgi:hypothetical protein